MKIQEIDYDFTICKISSEKELISGKEFYFVGKTDEELSLVCITTDAPSNCLMRDDGWRAFRIQGTLDFSLIGILSDISSILAKNKIGIFAISTFNTDYILVKKEDYENALSALRLSGYEITK